MNEKVEDDEMNEEKKNNLLPHPDAPTKATVLPDGTFNDILLRTSIIHQY
jgi:hypothetical protein